MRALAKMPATAAYRMHTEKIITERAKIVANVSPCKIYDFHSFRKFYFIKFDRTKMLAMSKIKSIAVKLKR